MMNILQIFIILLLIATANFVLSEVSVFDDCNSENAYMNPECFADSVDDLNEGE